ARESAARASTGSGRVGKSAGGRRGPALDAEQIRAILRDELRILVPEVHTMELKAPEVVAHERRTALSDLATRLDFVLDAVSDLDDFDAASVTALRDLVPGLAACEWADPPTGEALEALWQQTIDLLTTLSDGSGSAAAPSPPADDTPFWKR
ncbi:MAG: hypothetical protein ACRD0P_06520, partial [Stackebrandtia sp.]